nr:immunoglobulin light chain junction region [Macaca mulatta]MOW62405.1 immunoglobulin light chain junction region [Macaca mulatta]MOW73488.1 immunoglobulin light chain junction region [Macaca mulatta]MOW74604.1 immunoglobulin light chain junction region [Macaca mulatta]MOX52545.1 immunoglobulin light chain junction region [Macaca mulatta]
YMQGLEFPLTF